MDMNINKNQDFLAVYENVLSSKDCFFVINQFEQTLNTNLPSIIKPIEKNNLTRRDVSIFANKHLPECATLINDVLQIYIKKYVEEFFVAENINILSVSVKLQKTFPKGGFHQWHSEVSSLKYKERMLAWTIYLNDIPDGEGETEFLWQGVKIKPRQGRMVIFPAFFTHTHRGNPVYSTNKYIATGWFEYNEFE
jgi:hypothetical protein